MMRRPVFRSTALMLALAAMLFRGLVPAGWMPGASAGTPLVICSMSGPAHVHADANGKPAKHDNGRTDACPFGAAPHFAALDAPSQHRPRHCARPASLFRHASNPGSTDQTFTPTRHALRRHSPETARFRRAAGPRVASQPLWRVTPCPFLLRTATPRFLSPRCSSPPPPTPTASSARASFRQPSRPTIPSRRTKLALPTITIFNHETDTNFDYSKSIFPGFRHRPRDGYDDAHPPGGAHASGFSNLDVSPAMELFRSPEHEFIFSAGVDWEIGGSGSRSVADRSSTFTPTIKYGKGFGDLPDEMGLLRPFAVTGTVGTAITSTNSNSVAWAGARDSLLYLQNNVRDQGFSNFVAHLTPIVEYSFTSPVDAGGGGERPARSIPVSSGRGQYTQLAIEAIVPANRASGNNVGVIAQLHFYIDDIFPDTLGKPLFGGKP